jgi:tryptophan halogenase
MVTTTSKQSPKKVIILGGGIAGWMTAAAFSKLLPADQYVISLIESKQITRVGVGEATLPHLRYFNERLGIDEADFMRKTKATFKVGIEFSNWHKKGASFIHPFGEYGQPINKVDFHHAWTKQRLNGFENNLDEYSLPVMASLNSKFNFPNGHLDSVSSSYAYSYHIDAGQYAKFLEEFSVTNGVHHIEGKVNQVLQGEQGDIESLVLDNGLQINGDFFVDCSGFNGKLISQTLDVEFEDWTHWLPCNTGIALPSDHTENPVPYTKAIAQDAGWVWRIPLQHRLGNGHVFCDKFTTAEKATDELVNSLLGKPLAEPVSYKFGAGKPKKSWYKNCVAIGLASGFLEPLESTTLYLIQSSIMKLIEVFPENTNDFEELDIKAYEYNRCLDNEMLRIRDFLILHYCTTERTDTEFWRYCKNMSIPDSLSEKIELFKEFGCLDNYQHGLFRQPSWVAVYLGQGIIPNSYDPRIDLIDNDELQLKMAQIKHQVHETAKAMPVHQDLLAKYLKQKHHNRTKTDATMSLYGRTS